MGGGGGWGGGGGISGRVPRGEGSGGGPFPKRDGIGYDVGMRELPEDVSALLDLIEQIRQEDPKLLPVTLWLSFFSEPGAAALAELQPQGKDFLRLIEQVDRELLVITLWLLFRFELHSGQGLLEKHQPTAAQLTALLRRAPDAGHWLLDMSPHAQAILDHAYTPTQAARDLDRIIKKPREMRRIIAETPNLQMLLASCERRLKKAKGTNRSRLMSIRKVLRKTLEIDLRAEKRRAAQADGQPVPRFLFE